MPNFRSLFYLAILVFHTHFSNCSGTPISALNSLQNSEIDAMLSRVCSRNGVGGCSPEEEAEMPSETSRRVMLMQKRYISYETLRRDMVPCQKPGASYYDCRAGQANSYNRGCEIITRCARDIRDTRT